MKFQVQSKNAELRARYLAVQAAPPGLPVNKQKTAKKCTYISDNESFIHNVYMYVSERCYVSIFLEFMLMYVDLFICVYCDYVCRWMSDLCLWLSMVFWTLQ